MCSTPQKQPAATVAFCDPSGVAMAAMLPELEESGLVNLESNDCILTASIRKRARLQVFESLSEARGEVLSQLIDEFCFSKVWIASLIYFQKLFDRVIAAPPQPPAIAQCADIMKRGLAEKSTAGGSTTQMRSKAKVRFALHFVAFPLCLSQPSIFLRERSKISSTESAAILRTMLPKNRDGAGATQPNHRRVSSFFCE